MFERPFSTKGRIRRLEYGLSILIVFGAAILFVFPLSLLFLQHPFLLIVPGLIGNWFIIAQGAKRCHDMGVSGTNMFIPFYGFALIFGEGDLGDNKYGPNPKGVKISALSGELNDSLEKKEQPQKSEERKLKVSAKTGNNSHQTLIFFGIAVVALFILFIYKSINYAIGVTDSLKKENVEFRKKRRNKNTQSNYQTLDILKNESLIISDSEKHKKKSSNQNPLELIRRSELYYVQIMASAQPVSLTSSRFKKIKYKVVERYVPTEETYKYKYLVGGESTIDDIKDILKKIRKLGFKGAFIVKTR